MPTFASRKLAVTSQTLTTTLTLARIQQELTKRVPNSSAHTPGWRTVSDDQAAAVLNGVAGPDAPELWPAEPAFNFPERLAARFVWWRRQTVLNPDGSPAPDLIWMEGLDVLISAIPGGYQLLWSSQDSSLIGVHPGDPKGTVVDALYSALANIDPTTDVLPTSVLHLGTNDIYLWSTYASGRAANLGGGIVIAEVRHMATDEGGLTRARSGLLNGDVDMQRISFLSALAAETPLGPAALFFADVDDKGQPMLTAAHIDIDGRYGPLVTVSHYRRVPLRFEKKLRVVQLVAYRYIPTLQAAFTRDTTWGSSSRADLIVDKQIELSRYFLGLAKQNPQYAAWKQKNGQPHPPIN